MEEVKKPTTTQKVKVYEELLKELVQCNESLNYVKMESLLRKAYHYFESIENPKHKPATTSFKTTVKRTT